MANGIEAVVFDVDNTLMDFSKMKHTCISAAIDAMIEKGLPASKEDATRITFDIYNREGYEYQEIFKPVLKQIVGKIDWKLLATAVIAYRKEKQKHMHPYPKVRSTLAALRERSIKLAVLTDAPHFQAYTRLADLDLLYSFDAIVTHEDTYLRKPNPAPFMMALERLGVKPEKALMLGDWPEKDIAGAKTVGMKTALAKYGSMNDQPKNGPNANYK